MEYSTDLGRRVLLTLAGVALLLVVGLVLSQFLPTLEFTVFLYYASRPIYRRLGRLPLPKSFLKRAVPYQKQVHAAATIFFFLLPLWFGRLHARPRYPELQSSFGEGGLVRRTSHSFRSCTVARLRDRSLGLGVHDLVLSDANCPSKLASRGL